MTADDHYYILNEANQTRAVKNTNMEEFYRQFHPKSELTKFPTHS